MLLVLDTRSVPLLRLPQSRIPFQLILATVRALRRFAPAFRPPELCRAAALRLYLPNLCHSTPATSRRRHQSRCSQQEPSLRQSATTNNRTPEARHTGDVADAGNETHHPPAASALTRRH
ncbi:POU domain [Striga asiatica]|uniref:POU domain n=1 Tax=Striga asiatica TaxID=4170 RepID=A0A5A7PGI8_STRAF|nr:POU domain [Striga asiatica]